MSRQILMINPNVTEAITDVMAVEARRVAGPATTIHAVTAEFGTLYIENRVEAAIAGHAVVDSLAKNGAGMDAAIVSAFGDPGLGAAKELMDIPVIGISEAAFLTARLLGRRYAIVCLTERLGVWYRECAEHHGLADQLASVRPLKVGPQDITRAKEEVAEKLLAEVELAVAEDGAEVVIMGGGPIAGLAKDLADHIPVPVLDGVTCAIRLAEAMIDLAPRPPIKGSFARPPAKPSKGLSEALAAMIEHRDP